MNIRRVNNFIYTSFIYSNVVIYKLSTTFVLHNGITGRPMRITIVSQLNVPSFPLSLYNPCTYIHSLVKSIHIDSLKRNEYQIYSI